MVDNDNNSINFDFDSSTEQHYVIAAGHTRSVYMDAMHVVVVVAAAVAVAVAVSLLSPLLMLLMLW